MRSRNAWIPCLLVAGLALATAVTGRPSSSEAKVSPCLESPSERLVANTSVDIYEALRGRYPIFACDAHTHRRHYLLSGDPRGYALAGRYFAVDDNQCGGPPGNSQTCEDTVRVFDALTGKQTARSGTVLNTSLFNTVTGIATSSTGNAAWIRQDIPPYDNPQTSYSVHVLIRGKETIVATGVDVDPNSLALTQPTTKGAVPTLYWTQAGQPHSMPLP